jgi:hypothetical protein
VLLGSARLITTLSLRADFVAMRWAQRQAPPDLRSGPTWIPRDCTFRAQSLAISRTNCNFAESPGRGPGRVHDRLCNLDGAHVEIAHRVAALQISQPWLQSRSTVGPSGACRAAA